MVDERVNQIRCFLKRLIRDFSNIWRVSLFVES